MAEESRYTYTDENGLPVYDVVIVRTDELKPNGKRKKKSYLERIFPDGSRLAQQGCMDGVARVPYRLPELLAGIAAGRTVFFVEGEKCADALTAHGLVATTRSEGSGAAISGKPEVGDFLTWFSGCKEIVVWGDCDIPGRQASAKRALLFAEVVGKVRRLDLDASRSDGYDVADWLAEGHTVAELKELVKAIPYYDPPKIESLPDKPVTGKDAPHVDMARIFTLADLLQSAVSQTERAVEEGPRTQRTPFKQLNLALGGGKVEGGFSPGTLAVHAAAPGVGKSALLWLLADHSAAREAGSTVLISAEMGELDAVRRLIALHTGITMAQQEAGSLSAEEWHALAEIPQKLGKRRLAIIGRDGKNADALQHSLEYIANQGPISSIFYDHVGELSECFGGENDNEALGKTGVFLRGLAETYDCVVHAAMHLTKEGYKPLPGRTVPPRPSLAHLKGGGGIDGKATYVTFPWRPFPAGRQEQRMLAELQIAKCRNGATGIIPFRYVETRCMWVEGEDPHARPWFEEEV